LLLGGGAGLSLATLIAIIIPHGKSAPTQARPTPSPRPDAVAASAQFPPTASPNSSPIHTLNSKDALAVQKFNTALQAHIGRLGIDILGIYDHPKPDEHTSSKPLADGSESFTVNVQNTHGKYSMNVVVRGGAKPPSGADVVAVNVDAIERATFGVSNAWSDIFAFQASDKTGVTGLGLDPTRHAWEYDLESMRYDSAGNPHFSGVTTAQLDAAFTQAGEVTAVINSSQQVGLHHRPIAA